MEKEITNELEKTDILKRREDITGPPQAKKAGLSRRRFLGNMSGVAAAGMAAGVIGVEPIIGSKRAVVQAAEIGPETPLQRLANAAEVRLQAIARDLGTGIPPHPTNDDEDTLINFVGSYSKGLKHDSFRGEVDPNSYNAFRNALSVGTFNAIESLATAGHLGCPDPARQRRLVNPCSSYAYEMESNDSHQYRIRPAPAFSSAEEAGEMAELYWMALLRDVHFDSYATNPIAVAAASDLSQLSDFRGPKQGGAVTTQTLFRDNFPGCTVGPYISQFLLLPAAYGAQTIDMRIRTARANRDFGTTFNSWLDLQRGCQPTQALLSDGLRFCRNGRDIGQYVHIDALYQAYQVATLSLLGLGLRWDENNPYGQTPEPGSGLPLPPNTPGAKAQVGFGTFGGPDILATVCEASTRALRGVWYQKWLVHRRLRPETFGGRVEVIRLGRRTLADYPIHQDLFNSSVLNSIFSKFGTHLLPLAFPEGSPLHPAYGAGHATVAGACTTVLKAFFDENDIVPSPVVASADGRSLEPFVGPPLTVGGELNKLASNIATGRNIAGVHWRTDGTESILLGEEIAISMLRNMETTFKESFQGFKLTKFDGTTITI
ncbi:MAG TPA: vanadium-dependent haloperoxidase [Blastocatellia bacterium]|nr:vanadium-dependent haloperoxidase [Blastocatellia bacterium]